MTITAPRLPAYGVFAAMLSAAGLPIYIHAPKFYVDSYGVSLATLGAVLFGLRLLDVIQDPVFGRLSERLRHRRAASVALGGTVIGAAMLGLFAVTPPVAPVLWFGLMLTLVFSSFSFLTITFYAQGVQAGATLGPSGHVRLARWRETGALLGVCAAAIAPVALGSVMGAPFTGFALGFAVLAVWAVWGMRAQWGAGDAPAALGFMIVVRDPLARRLLLIALINAAPVAVSSTLFLFFVESRLDAPGWEGPLLLVFFLSAALAAPLWGGVALRFGSKPTLMGAMCLSIVSLAFALALGPGDAAFFGVVCLFSGAALGADLTLLPAMFSQRMAQISPSASEGFGLWSFVSKFTLAFAAVTLLPALQRAGFESGSTQMPAAALSLLTWLYAGVPCLLKALSLVLLGRTIIPRELS